VGKSTLLGQLKPALYINLSVTSERLKYERNPSQILEEIDSITSKNKLLIIDEIQKVPELLDDLQVALDRKKIQCVLTGSSARKLRSAKTNLLPGRLIGLQMDSISFKEQLPKKIEDVLIFGQLPRSITEKSIELRNTDLNSYVEIYLDEEVRQEALVRNIGLFNRFLELAALESGRILNYSKISKELGPTVATITTYFQILKDCLIIDFIDPITKSSTRKKLTKSPKTLFFDMGVRRFAAKEGEKLGAVRLGEIFEQQIGLECLKFTRNQERHSLHFWRDPSGPEVDWIVKKNEELLPIEVKWSENPDQSDTQHMSLFCGEYKNSLPGIVICRSSRKRKLKNGMTILPWQDLWEELDR
jgi:predicted AAA+ superfamily ATPase